MTDILQFMVGDLVAILILFTHHFVSLAMLVNYEKVSMYSFLRRI